MGQKKAKDVRPWQATEAVLAIHEAYDRDREDIRSFESALAVVEGSIRPSLSLEMTCILELIDPQEAVYHTVVLRQQSVHRIENANVGVLRSFEQADVDEMSCQELAHLLDEMTISQWQLPFDGSEAMRAGVSPIESTGLRLGTCLLASKRPAACAKDASLTEKEVRLMDAVVAIARRAIERTVSGPQLELSCDHRRQLETDLLGLEADQIDDEMVVKLIVAAAHPFASWKEIEAKAADIPSSAILHKADVSTLPVAVQPLVQAFRIVSHRGRWAALEDQPVFETWNELMEFCCETVGSYKHEEAVVIFLDQHNKIKNIKRMFRGTYDQVAVYPREIIKSALSVAATQFILIHNHPDGELSPSPEDISLTQELEDVCAPAGMGLTFVDHVIVTRDGYYSFKEHEEAARANRRAGTAS